MKKKSKERKPFLSEKHISILHHALDICEADYQGIGSYNAEKTLNEIIYARNALIKISLARKEQKK